MPCVEEKRQICGLGYPLEALHDSGKDTACQASMTSTYTPESSCEAPARCSFEENLNTEIQQRVSIVKTGNKV